MSSEPTDPTRVASSGNRVGRCERATRLLKGAAWLLDRVTPEGWL